MANKLLPAARQALKRGKVARFRQWLREQDRTTFHLGREALRQAIAESVLRP